MEVVWTETALETFFKVIDYLFDHWSSKEIETFQNNVDELIERAASFNQICPESKLFGYRKCIIDDHNSLIYHVADNNLLLLLLLTTEAPIHIKSFLLNLKKYNYYPKLHNLLESLTLIAAASFYFFL